jgi:hypothetical protein
MVLSVEERVFLVEYVFQDGNRYTNLVQEQSAEKFPDFNLWGAAKSAVYRDRPRTLNPLAPSDPYMGCTAQLTSRRCILNTYSTKKNTEE